jgi:hypothetical protein
MNKYLVMALLGMILVTPASAKTGEIKQIREAKREMVQEVRASKAAEFRQKLATIKDERKKSLLEKFDKQVAELNARRTTEMTKSLEQMSVVLNKRIAKGDSVGVDTANGALEIAKAAVIEQAAKVYVLTITDETQLRENANVVKSQLMADLKAVQDKMKAARQAVLNK